MIGIEMVFFGGGKTERKRKMKYLLVTLICIAMLVMPIAATADIGLGIDTDVNAILSQDVEADIEGEDIEGEIDTLTATVGVPISSGILFLRPFIGIAQVDLEIEDIELYGDEYDLGVESETGLLIGLEGKLDVYKTANLPDLLNDIQVSIIGSVQRSELDVDEVTLGSYSEDPEIDVDITYRAWEVGAQIAKDLGVITPYLGVVYTDTEVKYEAESYDLTDTLEAEDNIGLRLGLKGEVASNLNVSLDAKLIDQIAISGKITYKF